VVHCDDGSRRINSGHVMRGPRDTEREV
jgi:hypothetical protein